MAETHPDAPPDPVTHEAEMPSRRLRRIIKPDRLDVGIAVAEWTIAAACYAAGWYDLMVMALVMAAIVLAVNAYARSLTDGP